MDSLPVTALELSTLKSLANTGLTKLFLSAFSKIAHLKSSAITALRLVLLEVSKTP
jgi:hypothetical protein